jgi:hypothetical protein
MAIDAELAIYRFECIDVESNWSELFIPGYNIIIVGETVVYHSDRDLQTA